MTEETRPCSRIRVCVASSRWEEVGSACLTWAKHNLPAICELTDDPDQSDVFISVLYGKLVSEEFINRPGRRCYNFHPGILPQYRGAGAFSWCILNGDLTCGVTLHELDVDIDTGPILDQRVWNVGPEDTAQSLFRRGMAETVLMFQSWLPSLVTDCTGIEGRPQGTDGARTYYRKALGEQRDLTRFARAFHFEGKEQAFWRDRNGVKHHLTW